MNRVLYSSFFTLIGLCVISQNSSAQLPTYIWDNTLRSMSSSVTLASSSGTEALDFDSDGNVYSAGHFYGTIDANSGSGTTSLVASTSGSKGYIKKTDANGVLIWAKKFDGDGDITIYDMETDDSGNCYAAGRFSETIDFDPSSGTSNLTSIQNSDLFIVKLNNLGEFQWVKRLTSASSLIPDGISVDPSGNPNIHGYFGGTVDFNPGTGAFSMTGTFHGYWLRLDPSGNFVFAKQLASSGGTRIKDLIFAADGSATICGYHGGTTDFDLGTGVNEISTPSNNSNDIFFARYTSDAGYVWAKSLGGSNSDEPNAIALDPSGNLLVTGTFRNSVDFDPGTGVTSFYSGGSTLDDMFIAKYSTTGNFIWAKQFGNEDGNYTDENAHSITTDVNGNVVVTGFYYDGIDFDPGTGVYNLYTGLNRNTFALSLNPNGVFNWAFDYEMPSLGGSESEVVRYAADGALYLCGYTEGECDMDPGPGEEMLVADDYQGYVLKLGPPVPIAAFTTSTNLGCVGSPITLTNTSSLNPTSFLWTSDGGTIANPTSANTTITFSQPGGYQIDLTVTNISGSSTISQLVSISAGPTVIITPSAASICAGTSTTLTASASAGSVTWNTGQSGNSITVSPTTTTTYTASASQGSCTASTTQTITVTALPNITVSANDNTLCTGQTAILTANGGTSYTWSTGASGASISVSPTSTQTYSVTGTNNGCQNTANISVSVSALPTIAITNPTSTICAGQSVTLTATGGTSYSWSSGQSTAAITVSPATTTTYTVTGTNAAGCSNTANRTINVTPLPVITVNATDNTICPGTAISISATGGVTYSWNTGQTGSSINVSPTTNTTYTATSTVSGCVGSASTTVTMLSVPAITVSANDNSICIGESAILTANGGTSYMWASGQNTPQITVSPTSTQSYIVTGTNPNGCSANASVTITVSALPNVIITNNNATICQGNSATLVAGGAASYVWTSGQTQSSIAVTPNQTTTYTVFGTSAQGCTNVASSTVNVTPLPTISVSSSESAICEAQEVTLSATASGSVTWNTGATSTSTTVTPTSTSTYTATTTVSGCTNQSSITITVHPLPDVVIVPSNNVICIGETVSLTGTGADFYMWYTGEIQNAISLQPETTAEYSVTGVTAFGCSSVDYITIAVEENPSILITASSSEICSGESTTLLASGAASYVWNNGNITDQISTSPETTTTYAVIGTTEAGCIGENEITITVTPSPEISITAPTTMICLGESVELQAGADGDVSWSTGEITTNITVSPIETTQFIAVTNDGDCIGSASIEIIVNPLPQISITADDNTLCQGQSTTLLASGAESFEWSFGQVGETLTVTPIATTQFEVEGTSVDGCTNTATIEVQVQSAPNITLTLPTNTICVDGPEITLSASPAGGTFDGTGVSGDIFNPAEAGVGAHEITYVVENEFCAAEETGMIVVQTCIGVDEETELNLTIYPNPANQWVTIHVPTGQGKVIVRDESGRVVFEEKIMGKQETIEVSSLAAGVYFIEVVLGETHHAEKLIIQ